jgi:hypothetical protein
MHFNSWVMIQSTIPPFETRGFAALLRVRLP